MNEENITTHLTSIESVPTELLFDDLHLLKDNYKKTNIYNGDIKLPLHKIWLELPKLKLLGRINKISKDKPVLIISLILYDKDPLVKKLIKFITDVENKITNYINNENLSLKSCIRKTDKFYPSLTLTAPIIMDKEVETLDFDIYNTQNIKIKYNQIDSSSFMKLYIELNDVWITGKEYGINWRILQMKVYPEFNFKKCLFTDYIKNESDYIFVDVAKVNQPFNNIPPPPPPVISQLNKNDSINSKNNNNKMSSGFIPSVNDLLNTLNKLKPINKPLSDEQINQKSDNQLQVINNKPATKKIIKKKIVKKISTNNKSNTN